MRHVREAYIAAHQAVEDELQRQQLMPPPEAPPAATSNGHAAPSNGYRKERIDWNRDRPPESDRRPPENRRNGGGSADPPRNGKQLFAWAKGQEEQRGIVLLKGLQRWCQEQFGSYRFDALRADEIRSVYEQGCRMIESAD